MTYLNIHLCCLTSILIQVLPELVKEWVQKRLTAWQAITPPYSVIFNVVAFKKGYYINFFNIDNLFVMAQSEGCQARSKAQG